MNKTDFPVRAHSESSDEGYKAFTKDKRTRTTRSNSEGALYTSHRRESEGGDHFEKRRSYNPNFTRDNQLTERNKQQAGYRSERSFQPREERSFNREGGFNRERNFNREERPYNREGGFNRERNFNREGGERTVNRENREGGFNRERNFNREERSFNREGGFAKRSFTKGGPKRTERKPRTERSNEPKRYVNTANQYTLDNYPTYDTPKQEGAIRLNRYISMSGICSRREADEYIAKGEITVNGASTSSQVDISRSTYQL